MALEGFVDTITASASLRVISDFSLKENKLISNTIFNKIDFGYSQGSSVNTTSSAPVYSEVSLNIPFDHTYSATSPKHVLNIASLNVLQASQIVVSTKHTYDISNVFLLSYQYQATPSYIYGVATKYIGLSKAIYINTDQDVLNLDWNVQTNLIDHIPQVTESGGEDPGGDPNNNQTLKEFWA